MMAGAWDHTGSMIEASGPSTLGGEGAHHACEVREGLFAGECRVSNKVVSPVKGGKKQVFKTRFYW